MRDSERTVSPKTNYQEQYLTQIVATGLKKVSFSLEVYGYFIE